MKTVMDRYFYGVCGWTYSETFEDKNSQLVKNYFVDMTGGYQDLLLVRNPEEVPEPPKFLVSREGA